MPTIIQFTDTSDNIFTSKLIGAGDILTTSFRVWNNKNNLIGIPRVDKLSLFLSYPLKPAITIIAKNDAIKIRCTYSAKTRETLTEQFQSFPISDVLYDQIESGSYNEYEMQIDMSNFTANQKNAIKDIVSLFNVTVNAQEKISDARYIMKRSNTSILRNSTFEISSNTLIA